MGLLTRFRNRKIQGAELVVTGGITIFFSKIFVFIAPLTLVGYGLYRWLIKKSYKPGITSIAIGIILLVLLQGPLSFLALLPYVVGAAVLGYGAFLMVLPSKPVEELEETTKIDDQS